MAHSIPLHAGETWAELDPGRISRIEDMLPSAPAGFGKPIDDRRFWTDPATLARTNNSVRDAERFLDATYPAWDDDLYLDFSRTGQRPPGETMLRARASWLEPVVTAECIENKGRFLPAIHKTLAGFVEEPTWTLPAHDRSLENFRRQDYSVDLRSSAVAADLAQALWLLGPRIEPTLRAKVMDALQQRIFQPVLTSLRTGKGHWWLGNRKDPLQNNWNARSEERR